MRPSSAFRSFLCLSSFVWALPALGSPPEDTHFSSSSEGRVGAPGERSLAVSSDARIGRTRPELRLDSAGRLAVTISSAVAAEVAMMASTWGTPLSDDDQLDVRLGTRWWLRPLATRRGLALYAGCEVGLDSARAELGTLLRADWAEVHLFGELRATRAWRYRIDSTLTLTQAAGAAYELTPRLSLGLEALHALAGPSARTLAGALFVGPTMAIGIGASRIRVGLLPQVTSTLRGQRYGPVRLELTAHERLQVLVRLDTP